MIPESSRQLFLSPFITSVAFTTFVCATKVKMCIFSKWNHWWINERLHFWSKSEKTKEMNFIGIISMWTSYLCWKDHAYVIVSSMTPIVTEFWSQFGTVLFPILTIEPFIFRYIIISAAICEHPNAICLRETNPNITVVITSGISTMDWLVIPPWFIFKCPVKTMLTIMVAEPDNQKKIRKMGTESSPHIIGSPRGIIKKVV